MQRLRKFENYARVSWKNPFLYGLHPDTEKLDELINLVESRPKDEDVPVPFDIHLQVCKNVML